MVVDDRVTIRRRVVVQEAGSFLSAPRLVWSSGLVALPAFCTCRYCHFLFLQGIRSVLCDNYPGLVSYMTSTLTSVSFPGSVSVGVWQMACRRVIIVGEKVVKDFYG